MMSRTLAPRRRVAQTILVVSGVDEALSNLGKGEPENPNGEHQVNSEAASIHVISRRWVYKKVDSTRRASQAVPHPSTDRALCRLTSEFGWDRVYSTQYGRRHMGHAWNCWMRWFLYAAHPRILHSVTTTYTIDNAGTRA